MYPKIFVLFSGRWAVGPTFLFFKSLDNDMIYSRTSGKVPAGGTLIWASLANIEIKVPPRLFHSFSKKNLCENLDNFGAKNHYNPELKDFT